MTRLTKAQAMVQAIADDIVHGRFAPGTALDETVLAATYGVSRTPTREALRQLEAIGLVRGQPRRGAVVADVTEHQLDDMFAVMAELEAVCARWCALQMTASERRDLQEIHDSSAAFVAAGDRASYIEANSRFHEAIYAGSHNDFLVEMTLTVRRRLAPFRRAQFETLGRLAKSHFEHGRVVLAIQRADAESAARDMRAHLAIVRSQVEAVKHLPEVAGGMP